jgi:hypothetical protein
MAGMAVPCPNCGAEVGGLLCQYCGAATRSPESEQEEIEALDALHGAIAASQDDSSKARLLGNGPLPDGPEVLIDAGLRCAQLLEPSQYVRATTKAARRRLEVILVKLAMFPPTNDQVARARRELAAQLGRFDRAAARAEREGGRIVLGGCLVLVLLAVAVAVLLLR